MAETQLKLASAKKREQLVYETEKSRGKFGFRPAELWYPNNIPGTSLSKALFHVGFVPRQALPTPWQMVTFSSRSTWPKSAISVERVSDLEYAEPTPKSLEGQHTKGEAFHSF